MNKVKCFECGYDEHEGSLHVHHIDQNPKNNQESNLMVLCANCHMKYHHTTPRPKISETERLLNKKNNKDKNKEITNIIKELQDTIEHISYWRDSYQKAHFEDSKQISYLQEELRKTIGHRAYVKLMKAFREKI